METPFFTSAIDRAKNTTFKVNSKLFEIKKVFQEVSVIPEVNFNEKFIGELCIDLGYSVLNIVKSYV